MEEKIISETAKGYDILKGALDRDIEYNTIIRTKHTITNEDLGKIIDYDYYIYGKDRMFHRCNSEGKIGAKYQDRFLNYKVLEKDFEFYKILEEDMPTVSEEQVLFNKLSYENQQFILKQMRLLQPCEIKENRI